MGNKAAFTLIELMLYTVLVSVVALAIGGFCSTTYISLRRMHCPVMQELEAELVIDTIAHDVMSASYDESAWDVHNFVMTDQRLDAEYVPMRVCVGWDMTTLTNGNPAVRRSEGVYNFRTGEWIKRSVSIIGCPFKKLSVTLTVNNDYHITHARIRYGDRERSVKIGSREAR
jgi:type II secretory pathway component PulJ